MKRAATALAIGALGALLGFVPVGFEFERDVGLAWLFHLRGPVPAPPEAVVAAIDDQTGGALGISSLPREWSRSVHGQLVERLDAADVASIAFDFDFQLPKKAEDDAAFAHAIAASGRVVLAEKLLGKRQPLTDAAGRSTGSVWVERLVAPIAPLAEAARGLGSFPLPKVEVAVHEFWVFKPSVGSAPTMPAVALQVAGLGAWRNFARLARDAAPDIALPAAPPPEVRAADLREFMLAARDAFNRDPGLAARLTSLLDAQPDDALTARERRLVRALIGMYAGPDHRLLNFYGPPGSIATLPYATLAKGETPGGGEAAVPLAGRSVFVGFSDLFDPGQPDRFYTVYTNADGVDLSGVEIAATAFANLLTDTSVEPLGAGATLAVPLAFGVSACALMFLLPAVVGLPLTLALAAAYAYGAVQAFGAAHVWLPLAVPLLLQLPLAVFVGLVVHYLDERAKKNRATQAISLYLPSHLAHDFTERNLDSSALDRVVYSVCFASDMAGFTTIAEKMKPKELAVFLNDYFESLSEPLRRHGVDVIEFRADGIMCAWTAEQPAPEPRRQAIAAALDAVAAIDAFKARHALLAQNLRIGLETGMVYVGHAGGGGHFVYSIVGDSANTAARIEGLNKHLGTQLLASRAALEDVTGLVTRFVGEFRFVGKAETVPVVEVLGREGACAPEKLQIARDFDAAMRALGDGDWTAAAAGFDTVLARHPADGPSRYHRERCRRLGDAPPSGPGWVVNMDAK
ncbi:MAG: CHASE2 domain-containing protein [Gammaproteobacteria bacterium]